MRFSRSFRLVCSLALLQTAVVRCSLKSEPMDTVTRVLAWISADDKNWYNVLNQNVWLNRRALGPRVVDMLDEMEMTGTVVRVHRVLSYLVSRSDATGTQKYFGVDVIGDGLSCRFMKTVLMHLYYTYLYGFRPRVDVSSVRSCLSRIQVAMAGYVDKLFAFGRPVGRFVRIILEINLLFERHDQNPSGIRREKFNEFIERLLELGNSLLGELCPLNVDCDSVKIVMVASLEDDMLRGKPVNDHRLLRMINDMDEYRYVAVTALGVEFWMKSLRIVPYVTEESESAIRNDTDGNEINGDANYNGPFTEEL